MSLEGIVHIVDDDQAMRESLQSLVEPMGVATRGYASAEEFLAEFDPEAPGCLISDLRMIGMSGVELQQHLNSMGIEIPTIIMSAYADVPVAVQAMQAGAVILLEKPCPEQTIWEVVQKALRKDAENRAARREIQDIQERLDQLNENERAVMEMVVDGVPNKAIARRQQVSIRTVETRRRNVFQKMGVNTVAHLVQKIMVIQDRDRESS